MRRHRRHYALKVLVDDKPVVVCVYGDRTPTKADIAAIVEVARALAGRAVIDNNHRSESVDKVDEPEINTELQELGEVSEETKGGFIGHAWDGGFGVRPP